MLWEAAYRGRLAMVDYLLDQGADIHACGCHFTPLLVEISPYCAARYKRHHAVADRLLTRGAATDIYTAAFLGESDAVADYLDREPELATAEKAQHDSSRGMTVLHYAVSAGHLAIVAMLSGAGCRPSTVQWWADSLCRVAGSRRHPQGFARRWSRPHSRRGPSFRYRQHRNHRIVDRSRRHRKCGPRRRRLAAPCIPVARRSRRQCPARTLPARPPGPMSTSETTRARRHCTAPPKRDSTKSSPCCSTEGPR